MKNFIQFIFIAFFIVVIISGGVFLLRKQGILKNNFSTRGNYSTDISRLPEAKASQVIELKNGDTFNLTASIVKKEINIGPSEKPPIQVKMLAYNGSIPGPLIKVPQNAEITVKFKNETDVDTTVHSHGIRDENQFDGVPDVTQKAVKPGENFTYKLKFPDVGIYWYHPHIREDYAQELGLYGNFLVLPEKSDYWTKVNREETLFLDDILIQNGQIAPFSESGADHTLMGRFGNTMLINGQTNYSVQAKQGEVIRFYLTNSANTRTFNVTIPGVQMKLVGADNGKYEKEEYTDSIVLAPSERAIIEVLFDKPGSYTLEHKTPEKLYTLGTIDVTNDIVDVSYAKEFAQLRTNQDVISSIDPFRTAFDKTPDKSITLSLQMGKSGNNGGMMQHQMGNGSMMTNNEMTQMDGGSGEKIEWEDTMGMMNQQATTSMMKWNMVDQATQKSGDDINWVFKKGDKVKIKIFNDPKAMHPMQHPIHFHGQRFLVLSTNGVKNTNLVWKDTVLIGKGDTVEILLDASNPGTWMAHCHIAEHLESGMMLKYKVI